MNCIYQKWGMAKLKSNWFFFNTNTDPHLDTGFLFSALGDVCTLRLPLFGTVHLQFSLKTNQWFMCLH